MPIWPWYLKSICLTSLGRHHPTWRPVQSVQLQLAGDVGSRLITVGGEPAPAQNVGIVVQLLAVLVGHDVAAGALVSARDDSVLPITAQMVVPVLVTLGA